MKLLIRLALAALMTMMGAAVFTPSASAQEVDIYVTPGVHQVNGREWRTWCEPYSVTDRCTTEIWATRVTMEGGDFVQTQGWLFNNLTYRPSPREVWKGNPLAANGVVKDGGVTHAWTAADGRQWRTECDTALTGRGGCRSFIKADVIAKVGNSYQWQRGVWTFNSMVRFGKAEPLPPIIDIADVPAKIGEMVAYELLDGGILYSADLDNVGGVEVMAHGETGETPADWYAELVGPTRPFEGGVCGQIPESTQDYLCLFNSPKYGTISVYNPGAASTTDWVASILATHMP